MVRYGVGLDGGSNGVIEGWIDRVRSKIERCYDGCVFVLDGRLDYNLGWVREEII